MKAPLALATASLFVASTGFAQSAMPVGKGLIWGQVSTSYSSSDQRFAGPFRQGDLDYGGGREIGDLVPISVDEDGGEFRVISVSLSMMAGLTPRLSVGLYFPFWQSSLLTLETIEVERTGAGDLWTNASYLLTPHEWDLKLAARVEVKTPLSKADFQVLSLPLSEGQFDLSPGVLATWNFHGVMATSGLRWRYRFPLETQVGNVDVEFKPGNEVEFHAEVGGSFWRPLWLSAGWRSTWAGVARRRTLNLEWEDSEERRFHAAEFSAYFEFLQPFSIDSPLAISIYTQWPLAGVDMLSGPVFMGGVAWQASVWGE